MIGAGVDFWAAARIDLSRPVSAFMSSGGARASAAARHLPLSNRHVLIQGKESRSEVVLRIRLASPKSATLMFHESATRPCVNSSARYSNRMGDLSSFARSLKSLSVTNHRTALGEVRLPYSRKMASWVNGPAPALARFKTRYLLRR